MPVTSVWDRFWVSLHLSHCTCCSQSNDIQGDKKVQHTFQNLLPWPKFVPPLTPLTPPLPEVLMGDLMWALVIEGKIRSGKLIWDLIKETQQRFTPDIWTEMKDHEKMFLQNKLNSSNEWVLQSPIVRSPQQQQIDSWFFKFLVAAPQIKLWFSRVT